MYTHYLHLFTFYPFMNFAETFHIISSPTGSASGCGPGPSPRPSGARPRSPAPTDAARRNRRSAPPTSWGAVGAVGGCPGGKWMVKPWWNRAKFVLFFLEGWRFEMCSPWVSATSGICAKSGFNEPTERFHHEGDFKRLNQCKSIHGDGTPSHTYFFHVFSPSKMGDVANTSGISRMFIRASWPCQTANGFWSYPVGSDFETGRGVVEPANEVGWKIMI